MIRLQSALAAALLVTVPFLAAYEAGALGGAPDVPDPVLTPGVIASTDQADVCGYVDGLSYSRRHRATSPELKDWVFREYGITPPRGRDRGEWEIDHRVPLALGGADVAANLWPQAGWGQWNYHQKDEVEFRAWRAVCKWHTMTLQEGQAIFLGDWRDWSDNQH